MTLELDRRGFLEAAAATAAVLALPSFLACEREKTVESLLEAPLPEYRGFMDVYRAQWTWDRVVRSSHFLNCWYQSHCAWDVYVKDGLVFREEQAGEYPQTRPELPDFNPRGCQKGACFSERMYDATRVRHPLRRVGPRGGGRWERVSWDEALDAIADAWLDVAEKEGTDRIVWDLGPGYSAGTSTAAHIRLNELAQSVSLDTNGEIGDAHRGCFETFGKIMMERSADDYFHSDLILIWGCNPFYTQIPNAHFLTEARYHGARLVAIAPDYNASSTHADLWVPVAPGGDAALALGIAHVIVEEDRVARDFVVEQTDLPLLVRADTGRFLVEADLVAGGSAERYYALDEASGEVRLVPHRSLRLEDLRPALEGSARVSLAEGSEVEVRPVFALLRERLREYTPEQASKLCGTSPDLIRSLAREIADAKAVSNVTSSNFGKYYHGNLTERAIILVLSLTGNMGRPGAGYSGFPMLVGDGVSGFATGMRAKDKLATLSAVLPGIAWRRLRGDTMEQILLDFQRELLRVGSHTSAVLFWNVHGGLLANAKDARTWDPYLQREVSAYVDDALAKGWQHVTPAPGNTPRILLSMYSNWVRRLRGSSRVIETLLPQLKVFAVLDWRMSSTTRWADYVLPVSTWYERTDHKWVTPLSPFHHTSEQATEPAGESWSDWRIIATLAKKLEARARERGMAPVQGARGGEVRFDRLYREFTMDGRFTELDEAAVARALVEASSTLAHLDWDELLRRGFGRHRGAAYPMDNMCEIEEDQTIVPLTFHVRDKVPYPTATRRIQFHLDHPLYEELDEVLPRHKAPPTIGGEHPLYMTGGHTRWSIHSAWRDDALMLRLQRGAPFVLLSLEDAAARGIADGERVRVRNDLGAFEVRAKLAPQLRPGQAIVYHGWEDHQFRGPGNPRHLLASPINPVELAGGHPHLVGSYNHGTPGHFDRETRIEVERIAPGAPA